MPKKHLQGMVTSDKMQNTVVVAVEKMKVHPLYEKRMRRHAKYKAHNLIGAKQGDSVVIEESRPLSKDKKWIVVEILKAEKNFQKKE